MVAVIEFALNSEEHVTSLWFADVCKPHLKREFKCSCVQATNTKCIHNIIHSNGLNSTLYITMYQYSSVYLRVNNYRAISAERKLTVRINGSPIWRLGDRTAATLSYRFECLLQNHIISNEYNLAIIGSLLTEILKEQKREIKKEALSVVQEIDSMDFEQLHL